ncbi:MAG: hypothetical protein ACK5L5_10645 [Bacteroidales bacterium]
MFKKLDSKVTPFGGISLIHGQVSSSKVAQFIDRDLGSRGAHAGYKYSDIILSRLYTCFCGGDATEDVNQIRKH